MQRIEKKYTWSEGIQKFAENRNAVKKRKKCPGIKMNRSIIKNVASFSVMKLILKKKKGNGTKKDFLKSV